MGCRRARAATCSLMVAVAAPVIAATYHVDFEGGDDSADGLTPAAAWKHSPGDRNATGTPGGVKLQPGDTVILKGGVQYRGEIGWDCSGSEEQPIVLDGNTAGTFGEGRAVLDGSRQITGWQPCASAEQAQGNPRWKEILYADLEMDLSGNFNAGRFVAHRDAGAALQAPWQRLFLIDGEQRVLPIAMQPKPSDPFYPDLPSGFHHSPHRITDNYPHKVYYEEGSMGNRSLPLIAITYGGAAPVIQPFNGGAVSVDLAAPVEIAEMGFVLFRPASTPVPEHIVFLVDGTEVLRAPVDPKRTDVQRFALPRPTQARKLTFRLLHSNPGKTTWTKLQQIAAYTAAGDNVLQHRIASVIRDEDRLKGQDPRAYEGAFVGVHGGNNHTYFARVERLDPASGTLEVPHFQPSAYDTTRYAFYNAPRFLELPGEWCLAPLEGGKTRVFLLPDRLRDGQPVDIGFPVLSAGVVLRGPASHIAVRGLLIQRYAGGAGAVATQAAGAARPHHIAISDCEVRFVSGNAGISLNHTDHVSVENCSVHHCPGWTVGMYVNRSQNYRLVGNRLDTNAGSGIRHYESRHGVLRDNAVLNHFGMHSSGINFYEGCADILFENNYVHNTMTINRNAERLVFRNNVIDGMGKSSVTVGIWTSGSVGGRQVRDLEFSNNTFVNTDPKVEWATGILGQRRNSPGSPQGLKIRNNILDGLAEDISGELENNIFTRPVGKQYMGTGSVVVEDPAALFADPAKGDFRRRPGGPLPEAGANLAPPRP